MSPQEIDNYKKTLAHYLPPAAVDNVFDFLNSNSVYLHITRQRRTKLGDYRCIQRNHNNMALGYLVWLPSFWAFTPFVELDGGMARWQIDFLYNGASTSRKTLDPLKTAFAQLRIGASLIPEGFLKFDATTICLVASVDLNWYFSSDRITQGQMRRWASISFQQRRARASRWYSAMYWSITTASLPRFSMFISGTWEKSV